MKGKIIILLAFVFTFINQGPALGDGWKVALTPSLPSDVTGAYVKGYFTAAYDKANPARNEYYVHIVLQWDRAGAKKGMVKGIEKGKVRSIDFKKFTKRVLPAKEVHLFSKTIVTEPSKNLCEYTGDELKAKYWDLPSELGVPAAFGLPQATHHITQVKVTDIDSCGDHKKHEPGAMIRGEVEILLYQTPTEK